MNQRKLRRDARAAHEGARRSLLLLLYGKGVIFWETDAQAQCFVNYDDVNGADIYWFTDPNVCGSSSEGPAFYGLSRALPRCRRARNYGDKIAKLRRLDAMGTGAASDLGRDRGRLAVQREAAQGGRAILPAELRAAVWHSLIAGARGIEYFQHSFGGPCQTQYALRENGSACYQPIIDMVTAVNAQIKSLARVLNSPRLSSGFTANSSVRASAKWDGQHLYVLAGSMENASSTGNFSLSCVGNATATVLGESRSLPVANGTWSDAFVNGNAIHIYRIDGGSSCGL